MSPRGERHCIAEGHWTTEHDPDRGEITVHDPDEGPCEFAAPSAGTDTPEPSGEFRPSDPFVATVAEAAWDHNFWDPGGGGWATAEQSQMLNLTAAVLNAGRAALAAAPTPEASGEAVEVIAAFIAKEVGYEAPGMVGQARDLIAALADAGWTLAAAPTPEREWFCYAGSVGHPTNDCTSDAPHGGYCGWADEGYGDSPTAVAARRAAPTPEAPARGATATRYEFRPHEMFVGDPMDTARMDDPHTITVEWRGGDRWSISLGSGWSPQRVWCDADGEWEWEPLPSERDDAFKARTRYSRDDALAIAARLVSGEDPQGDERGGR